MYGQPAFGPPPRTGWWSRKSSQQRALLVALGVVLMIALTVGGIFGVRAATHTLHPSGAPQLTKLRQIPVPKGAVEVAHRTQPGTLDASASAWLTYQMPGIDEACPRVLDTFEQHGVSQEWQPEPNPTRAFCKPAGKGFASYCLPHVVCFQVDFDLDNQPNRFQLSTGSQATG